MSNQSAEYAAAKRYFSERLNQHMTRLQMTPTMIQKRTVELVIEGKLKCGVYGEAVYAYMAGKSLPTQPKGLAVATALGVDLEDLLPVGFELPESRLKRRAGPRDPRAVITVKSHGGLNTCEVRVNARFMLPAADAVNASKVFAQLFEKLGVDVVTE